MLDEPISVGHVAYDGKVCHVAQSGDRNITPVVFQDVAEREVLETCYKGGPEGGGSRKEGRLRS